MKWGRYKYINARLTLEIRQPLWLRMLRQVSAQFCKTGSKFKQVKICQNYPQLVAVGGYITEGEWAQEIKNRPEWIIFISFTLNLPERFVKVKNDHMPAPDTQVSL